MPVRWKLLGLAGVAGVAAGGAAVARRRRPQAEYAPDELRARLHERYAEVRAREQAARAAAAPPRTG